MTEKSKLVAIDTHLNDQAREALLYAAETPGLRAAMTIVLTADGPQLHVSPSTLMERSAMAQYLQAYMAQLFAFVPAEGPDPEDPDEDPSAG